MIRVEKVSKYFNKHKKNKITAINNTSLELTGSGLIALFGPSGCGKTTMLNAIGGLDKINKGKIFIDNKKITKRRSYKIDQIRNENIGYIFQDYKLINNKTVYENLEIVLTMIGIKDKKEKEFRIKEILKAVDLERYINRPCSMLSGGQKQRVGIARALIKDPKIILADEPTGNLDSRNSLEVMKIIHKISKNKLVILVTHEQDLARFFADRIIEIKDGAIVDDYKNNSENELEYGLENKFFLKEFNQKDSTENITIYSNEEINESIQIVIKNNNIYVKSLTDKKIQIVDEESNIEFIDSKYQKITKEETKIELTEITSKRKYKSIYNLFTLIKSSIKNILNYSKLKKLLLLGYFATGVFILFAISSLSSIYTADQEDYIKYNKDYIIYKSAIKEEELTLLENDPNIDYILPNNSEIDFRFKTEEFQLSYILNFSGSLSTTSNIEEIYIGEKASTIEEVVIDKLLIDKLHNHSIYLLGTLGIDEGEYERYLGKEVEIGGYEFKVVGITNENEPNIYIDKSLIYKVQQRKRLEDIATFIDYEEFENIKLTSGRLPVNKNEILLEDWVMAPKEIDGIKVKVVGRYNPENVKTQSIITNNETIKNYVFSTAKEVAIRQHEKDITKLKLSNGQLQDSFELSKEEYIKDKRTQSTSIIIISVIILSVSLIEIYLMLRSSFLSRIKEVGILRAIGVKKSDIYKLFSGEILAITTIGCIPGILLMYYILHSLRDISVIKAMFIINPSLIVISTILVYTFNLLIGLIPVFMTMRKTPQEILTRNDIE